MNVIWRGASVGNALEVYQKQFTIYLRGRSQDLPGGAKFYLDL